MVNLEQLLQDGRDLEHTWIELEPETDEADEPQAAASPPLGRVQLSTRALPALLALQAEVAAGGINAALMRPTPRAGVVGMNAAGGVNVNALRGTAPVTPHAPPPTEPTDPAEPEEAWLLGVETLSVSLMDAYGNSTPTPSPNPYPYPYS
mgnify:CR=1 FL=1